MGLDRREEGTFLRDKFSMLKIHLLILSTVKMNGVCKEAGGTLKYSKQTVTVTKKKNLKIFGH